MWITAAYVVFCLLLISLLSGIFFLIGKIKGRPEPEPIVEPQPERPDEWAPSEDWE